MTPDVSIITSTFGRPKLLANCIRQVQAQDFDGAVEHVIVTDGVDLQSRRLCKIFGLRSIRCKPERVWGARPKDFGLRHARGRCVVFWDDDNLYEPFALRALVEAAEGHDVGICRARSTTGRYARPYLMPLPDHMTEGTDYLCLCVKTDLARRFRFEIPGGAERMAALRHRLLADPKSPESRLFLSEQKPYDRRWSRQVFAAARSINHSEAVVGWHL